MINISCTQSPNGGSSLFDAWSGLTISYVNFYNNSIDSQYMRFYNTKCINDTSSNVNFVNNTRYSGSSYMIQSFYSASYFYDCVFLDNNVGGLSYTDNGGSITFSSSVFCGNAFIVPTGGIDNCSATISFTDATECIKLNVGPITISVVLGCILFQ